MTVTDELLKSEEVADWLKISVETVRAWRKRSIGPRATMVGGSVRYSRSDVVAWLVQQNGQS